MNPWDKYQTSESAGPWAKYGGATATAEPVPEQPASMTDKLIGSVPGRFLLGVGSPAMAAMQLLGGEKGREKAANIEAMKQRGMKAEGNEGFDAYGLLGSMLPGAGIAKGVSAALPAATTLGTKLLQGGAIGAATAAAQPVAPSQPRTLSDLVLGKEAPPDFWTEKAKQIGIGAGTGAIIPAIGAALSAARGAPKLNPVQAQTLQEGLQAGYVVPPSSVNPSFLNNRLDSLAGKASVGQEAAKRNQDVTNALIVKELGLPKGTSLTEDALKQVRKEAGKTYEEVSQLRPPESMDWFPRYHDKDLLEQLKKARADASLAYKSNTVTPHPDMLAKAEALTAKADSIDEDLAAIAKANNRDELVKALSEARTKFAKSYDAERALNLGDENISAPILGRQLDKAGTAGKSGAFSTIGKMAEAFPSAMREGARVPASGVSGTDAAAGAILGTLGYGAGGPAGLLAAGLPLLRGPARNLVLSPGYQRFATQGLSPQQQAILDALSKYTTGAAGTTAGRTQGGY